MGITSIFPVEVVEMIFHHLEAKVLKKAILVSPSWNQQISVSVRCMKKLKLLINGESKTFEKNAKKMIKSQRRFSNISINDGSEKIELIYKVVKEKHILSRLKSVEIYSTVFTASSELFKLLKVFESSIEEIIMHGVLVVKDEKILSNLNFAALKKLKIMYCHHNLLIDMFNSCQNLEIMDIENSKLQLTNPSETIKMLNRCKNLKQLNLNADIFNLIFSADHKGFLFNNLIEFSVTNFGTKIKVGATSENFVKFLQDHSNTIEKLHLGDFFGLEVLKFAFEMKSLKDLKMFHLPQLDWKCQTLLKPSKSIETLDILTTSVENKERIKCLLISVPNAERLSLRTIDVEVATIIKKHLKQLKTIYLLNPLQGNLEKSKEILSNIKFV